MPVFCLFILDRHGNFTAGVTMEQPDLLCTALVLNIEYYRVCRIRDVILEFKLTNGLLIKFIILTSLHLRMSEE